MKETDKTWELNATNSLFIVDLELLVKSNKLSLFSHHFSSSFPTPLGRTLRGREWERVREMATNFFHHFSLLKPLANHQNFSFITSSFSLACWLVPWGKRGGRKSFASCQSTLVPSKIFTLTSFPLWSWEVGFDV